MVDVLGIRGPPEELPYDLYVRDWGNEFPVSGITEVRFDRNLEFKPDRRLVSAIPLFTIRFEGKIQDYPFLAGDYNGGKFRLVIERDGERIDCLSKVRVEEMEVGAFGNGATAHGVIEFPDTSEEREFPYLEAREMLLDEIV